MNCEACQAALLDLVYGELPDDAAAAVREHLGECEDCGRERRTLDAARQWLDAAGTAEAKIPPGGAVRLLQEARRRAERSRWRWRRLAVGAAAAAAVLIGAQFLAVEFDVRSQRVVITWGDRTAGNADERGDEHAEAANDRHAQSYRATERDRVLQALVEAVNDDRRHYDQRTSRLLAKLADIEQRNDTRWRTLNHFMGALQWQQRLAATESSTQGDIP